MARQAKRRTQASAAEFIPAAYYRVSSEEQADSGLGLDAQRAACRGMAAAKGWQIAKEYSDEGISGGKPPRRRPGLASLIADIRAGKVNAVIIMRLDRLARDAEFQLTFERELRERGMSLLSCRETFDTGTAAGRMFFQMLAVVAEFERNVGGERTSAALAQLGKATGERGGKMAYGYRRVGEAGQVEIDPDQAATVRRIFERRDQGATLRQIAELLNADQVTPPGKGRQWHATSVMDILDKADAYAGGPRFDSSACWPAILV